MPLWVDSCCGQRTLARAIGAPCCFTSSPTWWISVSVGGATCTRQALDEWAARLQDTLCAAWREMQRMPVPVEPNERGVSQKGEPERHILVGQRVSLSRVGLQEQDRAGDRGQQCFGFIALETDFGASEDRSQHVGVELVQAGCLMGEPGIVLAHNLVRRP